jgi:hypothetical protein
MLAMRNYYPGAERHELEQLDSFYGRAFALWRCRVKDMPRTKPKEGTGPMTLMNISTVTQRVHEALLVADGGVTMRIEEALQEFVRATLLAGYISQGRPGVSDSLSAPGSPCIHPICPDRARCMGVRFADAGEIIHDSGGLKYHHDQPYMLLVHYKRNTDTDATEVHFVYMPPALASDSGVWTRSGRDFLLRHHGKEATPPDMLLLGVTGHAFNDHGRHLPKDVVYNASRALGLPPKTP